jgi:hypothetical protein
VLGRTGISTHGFAQLRSSQPFVRRLITFR